MTLPKKGHRKITVEGKKYVWNVTGNDGWLSLCVVPMKQQGNLLTANFSYHSVPVGTTKDGEQVHYLKQGLIITGYVVRQVILYALNAGWQPLVKGCLLNLVDIEQHIDLRLEK
ncbi:hypothetical protein [Chitinophaga qingshengii]|uniref:DUF5675 domain-containing protein n=1 Tax=Chitinophaga qingshengii TaxID=1569794 RepID=A0ABR7TRB4_9BACT|nr:hypothetical protein [Chitinophaga qingshengii]MBC9933035.1 hypothetical protein [Chitinophaga qingshengii]